MSDHLTELLIGAIPGTLMGIAAVISACRKKAQLPSPPRPRVR